MSSKTSPSVISIAEIHNLSTGAKLGLIKLFSFRNHNSGLCNPTLVKVAERSGNGLRTVKRWVAELKAAGAVRVIKGQRGARYEFADAALVFCGARKNSCGATVGTARGATVGTAGAPHPYTNLSLNRESSGVTASGSNAHQGPSSPPPQLRTPRPTPTQGEFVFAPPPQVSAEIGQLPEAGSPGEPPSNPVEESVVERKPPVRAQAPQHRQEDAAKFQRVRGSLHDLADAIRRAPPDDGFVRMILAAAPEATGDQIHETLVNLWKRDAFSTMRGWGLVLVKFKDCCGAAA